MDPADFKYVANQTVTPTTAIAQTLQNLEAIRHLAAGGPTAPTANPGPAAPSSVQIGTATLPLTSDAFFNSFKMKANTTAGMLFGPERESWISNEPASRPERFARDWILSEQEFRASADNARKGNPLKAAGWGLLAAAGAVPLFGDAAQFFGKGGRFAAEATAADLALAGPVIGRDMGDELASEIIKNNTYIFTQTWKQARGVVREMVGEVFHRQGYDGLPTSVDAATFDKIAASAPDVVRDRLPLETPLENNLVAYRGITDELTASSKESGLAVERARDFIEGDLYIGGGTTGPGTYVALDPAISVLYAGKNALYPRSGALIRMILPKTARVLNATQDEVQRAVLRSPFMSLPEFAAAKGYDAVLIPWENSDKIYALILNRTALVVDKNVVRISPEDVSRVESSRGFIDHRKIVDEILSRFYVDG